MRLLKKLIFKGSSNLGPPRRRVKIIRYNRITIIGIFALAAVLLVLWPWEPEVNFKKVSETAKRMIVAASIQNNFVVKKIVVDGMLQTDRKKLANVLNLYRGSPILTFDASAALERVTNLPWVERAIIERRLPNIIRVKLMERRAMALWQNKGEFALIDYKGKIIVKKDLRRFSQLIVVVGRDAPENTHQLVNTLAIAPELARRVEAAVRVGGRRWNIKLNNKSVIYLPEQNPMSAWAQLAEVNDQYKILEKGLHKLDLRIPDRIILSQPKNKIEKPKLKSKLTINQLTLYPDRKL
ncbi:MAG: cell division protein FtsQ/DivIB [Pseudomonadota bacterium]|nr:cell division protein FtsQ/DivIB [Pseudomonadota bacterium]